MEIKRGNQQGRVRKPYQKTFPESDGKTDKQRQKNPTYKPSQGKKTAEVADGQLLFSISD